MGLSIVDVSKNNVFTVESDLGSEEQGFKAAHAELMDPATKKWVQKEAAARGVSNPTLGLSHSAPYAVTSDGTLIDGTNPDARIHRYRADIQVNAA